MFNFFKKLFKKKSTPKREKTDVKFVKLKNGDTVWIVTRDGKTRYYRMKKSE